MTKPTSVNIMGRKIQIRYVNDLTDDGEKCSGLYHHDAKRIDLDPEDPAIWATLLHEMVHAVLMTGGVAEVLGLEKEEAVCRAIENLAPLLSLKPSRAKKD